MRAHCFHFNYDTKEIWITSGDFSTMEEAEVNLTSRPYHHFIIEESELLKVISPIIKKMPKLKRLLLFEE